MCNYEPGCQWLTGMEAVNYHTLSDFRVEHKEALDKIFVEVLGLLSVEGLVEHVPYRGDALLLPALLRNEIDLAITAIATIREHPSIRVLAVFDDARNDAYPDAPIAKQLGIRRSVPPGQVGLYGPKDLSAPVEDALNKACAGAAKDPDVLRVITTTGQRPKYLTGAEYRQNTIDDYKFKGNLIKSLGLLNQQTNSGVRRFRRFSCLSFITLSIRSARRRSEFCLRKKGCRGPIG